MFKSMKISMRLGLGFGLVLLLMVVLIITGISRMAEINGRLDEIVNDINVEIDLAHEMRGAVRDVSVAVRNIVLVEPTEMQEEVKRIEEQHKLYSAAEEKLTSMTKSETGKAILATLSNEKVKALIGEHGLQRQTRFSVASVDALLKQLDRFRHAGYAVDDEEMAEGMHCFGAPVFTTGKSEAIAAVAVSLIKASTSVKRKQEVIQQVADLAKEISRRLGALS